MNTLDYNRQILCSEIAHHLKNFTFYDAIFVHTSTLLNHTPMIFILLFKLVSASNFLALEPYSSFALKQRKRTRTRDGKVGLEKTGEISQGLPLMSKRRQNIREASSVLIKNRFKFLYIGVA